MKTVIIFGGSGFVGRHIIRRLAKKKYKIIVPYQRPVDEAKLRLLGTIGQIIPLKFSSLDEKIILNQVKEASFIINLKTLWDQKKITFNNGILNFNKNLIYRIKNLNPNCPLIYFSGIGIDEANNSRRSEAIHESEKIFQDNLYNAIIIRPSVIIGGDDRFLRTLIGIFKISFIIPIFGNGESKFQPVYIDDVSLGVIKIIEKPYLNNQIFEFVGNEIFSYKNFYKLISSHINKKIIFFPVPLTFLKFLLFFLEKTPFSIINREQLKLFEKDNIAKNMDANLFSLGIKAQDLREIIKKIVIKNT